MSDMSNKKNISPHYNAGIMLKVNANMMHNPDLENY